MKDLRGALGSAIAIVSGQAVNGVHRNETGNVQHLLRADIKAKEYTDIGPEWCLQAHHVQDDHTSTDPTQHLECYERWKASELIKNEGLFCCRELTSAAKDWNQSETDQSSVRHRSKMQS